MKNHKKSVLLILLFGILNIAISQSNNDDYIVLNNNDTLYGTVYHINNKTILEFYKKIRFINKKGKRKKYKRTDLLAFKSGNNIYQAFMITEFTDGNPFDRIRYTLDEKHGYKVFYKRISTGKVSHYQYEWIEQGEALIMSMDLIKKESSTYFIRATQGLLGIKRKALIEYFYDCSQLQEKIKKKEIKKLFEVLNYYKLKC